MDEVACVTVQTVVDEVKVGRQTVVGGTWMIGARLISRVIDLCTLLVLARVLRPQDFGVVAIAMTVIYILEAALELPVSQALVRLPVISGPHLDTAFTLSIIRGALLSATICGLSVPLARIYGDERLIPLVCFLSMAPAARGLVSPSMAHYSKRCDFSRDFSIELIGKLVALTAAVSIAVVYRSYWSIAVGTVAAPLVATIASYVLAPYRPRLTFSHLSSFSGFLGWITVAQIISALNWQTDRLLLGKLTSRAELGLFTTANDLANIPLMTLFGPIQRPLLSAFSQLRHDLGRLQSSYQTSASAMVTLALPLLVGESLLATPGVRLLFGERWIGAAPMLRWLAISLIPSLFAMPMAPLVMSLDKTQTFVKRNSVEICIKIPLVVLGALNYRFYGVIVARMISETITVLYCMIAVRRMIGLPLRLQLMAPWRSISSTVAMAGVLVFAVPALTGSHSGIPLLLGTLLSLVLGAAVYITVLFALWRLADYPPGIEAMAASSISYILKRTFPSTSTQLR
jgi:PST family polysaccharide transporter